MTQMVNVHIFCAIVSVFVGCHSSSDNRDSSERSLSRAQIDTTIVRIADYTGDSVPDTARLTLTAKPFTDPVSWSFDVVSQERVVFHREDIDTWMDSLFADPGFVSGCSGYDNCKRKWYFEGLGLYVLKSENYDAVSMAEAITDTVRYGSLFYRNLVDSCGISPDQAQVMADSMASALKSSNCLLVWFLDSPHSSGPVLVYVDRLRRFCPVYDD